MYRWRAKGRRLSHLGLHGVVVLRLRPALASAPTPARPVDCILQPSDCITAQPSPAGPDATEPVVKSDFVTIRPIVVRVGPTATATGNGTAAAGPDGDKASPAHKRQRTDGGPQQQPGEAAAGGAAAGARGASGPGSPAGEEGWQGGAADPRVYEGRARPMGLSPPDSVVYLAQLSGRPGKFNPERAKALGVEPGPVGGAAWWRWAWRGGVGVGKRREQTRGVGKRLVEGNEQHEGAYWAGRLVAKPKGGGGHKCRNCG